MSVSTIIQQTNQGKDMDATSEANFSYFRKPLSSSDRNKVCKAKILSKSIWLVELFNFWSTAQIDYLLLIWTNIADLFYEVEIIRVLLLSAGVILFEMKLMLKLV